MAAIISQMHLSSAVFSKMLILGEADVRRCLSMKDCLEVNRRALQSIGSHNNNHHNHASLSSAEQTTIPSPAGGGAGVPYGVVPTRIALPFDKSDWTLFKPAAYYDNSHHDNNDNIASSSQMGIKVVSVRSKNPQHNKPLVPATILLLDAASGEVNAMVSATYLTAARTAAGSALATKLCLDALAQQQQQQQAQTATSTGSIDHLVVFGAGLQAECHIDAIHTAMEPRTFQRITIVNRSLPRAEALRERIILSRQSSPHCRSCDILLLDSHQQQIQEALSTADVIVTTTNSATPLWADGTILKPGCHINGIGSYTPDMQEVDVATVNRSWVFVDTWEALTVGDLKHLSLEQQQQQPRHSQIRLLGDVLISQTNDMNQPQRSLDCTFYKAVGTAIQDIMTATIIVDKAREMGIGTYVDMS